MFKTFIITINIVSHPSCCLQPSASSPIPHQFLIMLSYRLAPSMFIALLSLIALVPIAATHSVTDFLTLPSGRRIPLSIIHASIPINNAHHSRHIFELSPAGMLSGHQLSLDILNKVSKTTVIDLHPDLQVTVNGKSHRIPDPPVVRSGTNFQAVYAPGDDHPVSITMQGDELIPLHMEEYPGIYIRHPQILLTLASHKLRSNANKISTVDSHEPSSLPPSFDRPDASKTSIHIPLPVSRQVRRCAPWDARRYIELAIASDNRLCSRFGNKPNRVVAKLASSLKRCNTLFTGTCARIALVHVELHCRNPWDPYRSFRWKAINPFMASFLRFWRSDRKGVKRDLAIFVRDAFSANGRDSNAYVGRICSKKDGFGAVTAPRADNLAFAVARSLGADRTTSGILGPYWLPFRFSAKSVKQIRSILETNVRSRCITSYKRICNPSTCWGRCVSGACVREVVGSVTPTPSAFSRTCGSSFRRETPPTCVSEQAKSWIVFKSGATVRPFVRFAFGRVHVRFVRIMGNVVISAAARVGEAPTSLKFVPFNANTAIFERWLDEMSRPGSSASCCWKNVIIVARVKSCKQSSCQTITRKYSLLMRCPRICLGGGNPLPMSSFRRCPKCS